MGDSKDLNDGEAAHKIKQLAVDIGTCMFCTYEEKKLKSRPMSVQEIDDEGNLWFLSNKKSNKNKQIMQNSEVELFFASRHDKFLSLHGKASINYDKNKIEDLWNPIIKVWITGGVDDTNLSIIKVTPKEGYYWNNKNGKMVAFAKMTASLLAGITMDDGIEGNLIL